MELQKRKNLHKPIQK